jgi:signal transduction histidine kinase
LRNRLELAQRSPLAEAGLRDAINAACRETDVILEIFGALMRIAQVESGARRTGFAVVGLSEVIDTVVEVYKPAVEEKRQCLVETIAKDLTVFGDKELLTQLFANVLENAILHSPPGARTARHAASASDHFRRWPRHSGIDARQSAWQIRAFGRQPHHARQRLGTEPRGRHRPAPQRDLDPGGK